MSTKTLDLRGLTDAERDAKVNITVAHATQPIPIAITDEGVTGISDGWSAVEPLPPYATSADAVLPLLKDWQAQAVINGVTVVVTTTGYVRNIGNAPTFPLAACLALLRANGYEVLT